MLNRLERLGRGQVLLLCGLIWFAVTGWGILMAGPNPDDWRQMAGAPPGPMPLNWTDDEGRWAMELIYVRLLGERFLTPLQILLAFPCLAGIAHLLARRAAPEGLGNAAMLAIFVIGTSHVYMSDALNFSAHLFAYPLALLLSALAFALIAPGAAGLLAVATGIYQPFAVFGAVLPLIGLMRWDRLALRPALFWLVRAALAGAAGLALYVLLWRFFASLTPYQPIGARGALPGAEAILAKLAGLPVLLRHLFTGGLMNLSGAARVFNGLFGLAVIGAVALAALAALLSAAGAGTRLIRAARVGAGGLAALLILPVLAYLAATEPYLPGRAVGYFGFLLAAMLIAALALVAPLGRAARALRLAGAGALAVMGTVQLFTAAALWHDQMRQGERDRELARLIMARVAALPGYDGGPIRILGGLGSDEFSAGGSIGYTVFHPGNSVPGIFREMFGFGWTAEFLAISPRACPAFPAHDAVWLEDGRAHVCLSPFAQDLMPLAHCAPLGGGQPGTLCAGRGMLILARPDCAPLPPGRRIRARLFDAAGREGPPIEFTVDVRAFTHQGRCLQAWPDGGFAFARIVLGEYDADGMAVWEREFSPQTLRETLAGAAP